MHCINYSGLVYYHIKSKNTIVKIDCSFTRQKVDPGIEGSDVGVGECEAWNEPEVTRRRGESRGVGESRFSTVFSCFILPEAGSPWSLGSMAMNKRTTWKYGTDPRYLGCWAGMGTLGAPPLPPPPIHPSRSPHPILLRLFFPSFVTALHRLTGSPLAAAPLLTYCSRLPVSRPSELASQGLLGFHTSRRNNEKK